MMKCRVTILFFLFASECFAQNLVSNPGFETCSAFPTGIAQYYLATGWNNCNGTGSPDYFSTLGSGQVQLPNCFVGTVTPNSGNACMGGALYYFTPPDFREYISTQLISPLVPGQTYNVSFYVTNGTTSGFYGGGGIDKICAAFSTQPLTQTGNVNIPVVPQIVYGTVYYSYTWQLLSMQFVADSAYEYMTIGNFFPDASTTFQQFDLCPNFGAYYFFDDIDVSLANTAPLALFTAPHHICPGTCTDFTNLSINATSYIWNFSGANPSVSIDANPVNICYNTPGSYDVQLIATNSVTSDTLTLVNYITVYPYPPPQGIVQTGDTLSANQGAVSYQWYQDGNIIPGATEYFYVATGSGNYNIVATDANGCEVEAAIFDVIASLQPALFSPQFFLFPNPARHELEFRNLELKTGAEISIMIYDVMGGKINSFLRSWNSGNPNAIDVSNLAPGIYTLELKTSGHSIRSRFIKQ